MKIAKSHHSPEMRPEDRRYIASLVRRGREHARSGTDTSAPFSVGTPAWHAYGRGVQSIYTVRARMWRERHLKRAG